MIQSRFFFPLFFLALSQLLKARTIVHHGYRQLGIAVKNPFSLLLDFGVAPKTRENVLQAYNEFNAKIINIESALP